MCLAIAKPANAVVPVEHLHAGHEGNPHGCGFAYAEKGKLYIEKGLLSFKDFMTKYRQHEHLPMLIHFRYSTHGQPSILNCHPFPVWDGRFVLVHNGTINIASTIDKMLNDTGHFTRLIMEPMLKSGINPEKASFRWLVEQSIGTSKVLLMDVQGKITIYNEELGEYEYAVDKNGKDVMAETKNGSEQATVWYSNAGYKFTKRKGKQKEGDSYDGFYDVNSKGEEVVPADFSTKVGLGFQGTPKSGASAAKLDTPPGIVTGFKSGIRNTADPTPVNTPTNEPAKSAEFAAAAIVAAHGGKITRTEKNGVVMQLNGEKKDDNDTMITGPLFNCKAELEIAFLKDSMDISRSSAIKYLGLEEDDAVSIVEV